MPVPSKKYISTAWLSTVGDITGEEDNEGENSEPDHEVNPTKLFELNNCVHQVEPQNFAEVSSIRFSKDHLGQAKIKFDINDADSLFTPKREALQHFPWSIFEITKIPTTDEHVNYLRGAQEKANVIRINEGTYQQVSNNWTIEHVINDQWRDYFSIVRTAYLTIDKHSKNDAKVETMAEQLCHYFGFTVSRYYTLHQYPTFPVHVMPNAPIEVKPSVVAGHVRLDSNGHIACFFSEDSSMAHFLRQIIQADGWTPSASRVFVPTFIAECNSTSNREDSVYKLLLELAIIRDIEKRLFKAAREFTLGVYCHDLTWQFYVLEDYNDSPDYLYKAHHICTHELTKSYLTWLQLGVVLQRLAAYNLSCTRQLELISESQQAKLIEEIKLLSLNSHNSDELLRNDWRALIDKADPAEIDWQDVADATITQEIYSGPSTRVCLALTRNGFEVAMKLFDSHSEALYEATVLHKLRGRYVARLLRFDSLNEQSRLILEKLNPLPNFTTHEQLQKFVWELLQALRYVHSKHYVHGDIKHANIMLSTNNCVKLIDFAYATTHYPGQTLKYTLGGTNVYMSPERLAGRFECNKIDVFAAGLVCAEKMYSTRIDSFTTREKLIQRIIRNNEISELATLELIDRIRLMLEVDTEKRPSVEACLKHRYFNAFKATISEPESDPDPQF